jgi:hypothetical protein
MGTAKELWTGPQSGPSQEPPLLLGVLGATRVSCDHIFSEVPNYPSLWAPRLLECEAYHLVGLYFSQTFPSNSPVVLGQVGSRVGAGYLSSLLVSGIFLHAYQVSANCDILLACAALQTHSNRAQTTEFISSQLYRLRSLILRCWQGWVLLGPLSCLLLSVSLLGLCSVCICVISYEDTSLIGLAPILLISFLLNWLPL